jgi:hypothetical protein
MLRPRWDGLCLVGVRLGGVGSGILRGGCQHQRGMARGSKGCEVEQSSDESAEAEVRDLDAKLPQPLPPADLGGGRIRPAALVRWGFFAGVGLLLAYGAAQALLSVRNLLVLVLVAMFLAVSLDPAVRWLTARGLPRGLAVALILVVLVAILAAFLVSVIPHLVSQFTTLVHTLPTYLAQVADRSRRYQDLNTRYQLSQRLEGVVA